MNSIRSLNPDIYGIDWDATDEPATKKKTYVREKPFCTIEGCTNRVSTTHGKPKPWCTDHIFESPYVQEVLKRLENLDEAEERNKTKEAWERAQEEHNEN